MANAPKPKKPAKPALGASLVAVTSKKGAAQPSQGIVQREPTGMPREYAQLNLKVEPDWFREFSVYAAQTDRSKKELIEAAFAALREKESLR